MKKIRIIASVFIIAFIVAGCKPTEKNYQSAYDAAMQKRKEARQSEDSNVGRLNEISGIHVQQVGTDTLFVLETFVKPLDKKIEGENPIGVAISKYAMPTNANRQLADLSATEPNAFVAIDGVGSYYVIIDICEDMEHGARLIESFKSRHPGYPFIGLPEEPALVSISE